MIIKNKDKSISKKPVNRQSTANEEQLFRQFADSSPVMVWIAGSDALYTYFNTAWLKFTGRSLNQEIACGWTEALHPDDMQRCVSNYKAAFTGHEKLQHEYRLRRADGEYRWIMDTCAPRYDTDSEFTGYVGYCVDITEHKLSQISNQIENENNQLELEDFQETESEFRAYFAAMSDAIFILNREGKYCKIAPTNPATLYRPPQLLLGKELHEVFDAKQVNFFLGIIKQALDNEGLINIEYSLPINGKEIWFNANISRFQEDLVIWVARDITEYKYAELILQKNHSLLHSVIDGTPDMIFAKDLEGKYVLVNQSYATYLQQPIEIIIGQSDRDLFASTNTVLSEVEQRIIATGNAETFEEKISINGTEVTVLTTKSLWCDTNEEEHSFGQIKGIIGISRDISERKQAEASLAEMNLRFATILNNAPIIFYTLDKDGTFIFSEGKALEKIGLKPGQVVGMSAFELYKDNPTVVNSLRRAFAGKKESWTSSIGDIHFQSQATPIKNDNGEITGIIGIALDVSDRKQAELEQIKLYNQSTEKTQQLEIALRELQQTQSQLIQTEKMSSLGQLVAGIAHEINNPVNFIYGNLKYAEEYIIDLLHLVELYRQHYPQPISEICEETQIIDFDFIRDDLPKLLTSMMIGSDRIRQIVLSLRNFSRLDEADMKAVDIHDGIDNTLLLLQNRLKAKSEYPEIEVIKEYGDLPLVECYAGQLNQVFMNLLTNAIDALEGNILKEGPKIVIHTSLKDGRVFISITDNGMGMSQDTNKRLFDPFFTTKAVGKGTGMGLSISYQIIVQKHRGRLMCISAPGEGAEFIIIIPLRQNNDS
jgi:PAS domain S-box-containing protein